MLTTARNHLCKADAVLVARIEAAVPTLSKTRELIDSFGRMVRNGTKDALVPWLETAEKA